jgi:hypothetical protein|tara:strand:- start:392 stop:1552 length:1161 start_codon:yes stop_codon:yes gene_type:complete
VKKILFVTNRYPEIKNYSGDTLLAYNIIKYLRKKNTVDVVCTHNINKKYSINKQKNGKIYLYKKNNILVKIFYTFMSIVKLKPMQIGFFYSKEIKKFLFINHKNYQTIIFHTFRSAQYLPVNFKGKKILEMTDIMSDNYDQTKKKLNIFNPLYFLYSIESFLLKKYEIYCFKTFNKIVLIERADVKSLLKIFKKKIITINIGIDLKKKIFKFKKKNSLIIFIGNVGYLPNKYACYDFVKNILPKINIIYPDIKFYIIGKINIIDKIKLGLFKNVKVLGVVGNLQKYIKSAICGISNLQIATGTQIKILTYMSYGLPTICSHKSALGINKFRNRQDFFLFNNNKNFINQILELKKKKVLANRLSNNSYLKIKKLGWEQTLLAYKKII